MMDPHADGPGRRGVLGLGLGGAAALSTLLGAPAAAASAATGAAGGAPDPHRTRSARFGGAGTFRPGFTVGTVAVRWTGGTPRLRTLAADGTAGPWRVVRAGCQAGAGDTPPDPAARTSSALVDTGAAAGFEVAGGTGTRVVALESSRGAATSAAAQLVAGRRYLNRRAWGADESLRFDATGKEKWVPAYYPVQTLTVHHTGTINDDPDPPARIRAIYRNQAIGENIGDFGYHAVIDEAGNLYEGRWSGTDPVPGFDTAGRMVNGAHITGYNAGNVGIVLLGTLDTRAPTPAAYSTLVLVLGLLTAWHGLDPLARTTFVNPVSGVTAEVPVIAGHRDWPFVTNCPGHILYAGMRQLRQDVAAVRDGRTLGGAAGERA
jgi:hypothetical protein